MQKVIEIEYTNRSNITLEVSADNGNVDISNAQNRMIELSINQGIQGPSGVLSPDTVIDGGTFF